MNRLCGVRVGIALSAVVGMAWVAAQGQTAAPMAADGALGKTRVFQAEQMAVAKTPNGSEVRDVVHGALATGEVVAVHETIQPAGTVPVPLHTIKHSELIVVEQGMVAFEHDGQTEMVGPGGVIFVAYGTNHRVRNAGDGPARYTVVQIGGDTKR